MSGAMFEEFIVPELEEITGTLGPAIYHLDGPDAIRHLDRLCDIPGIRMIQWVPGAGKPGCGSEVHFPLYRKVRKAGKGLVLGVDQHRIQPICKELGAAGVLFQTSCRTAQRATDLLAESCKWI